MKKQRTLGLRLALIGTRRVLANSGAARMLVIALLVAVAAVTAVARLTDRVDAAITAQAAQTLGADLALELDARPTPEQRALLSAAALTTARSARLTTALAVGDNLLRVSVQAVSPNYPPAGNIRLRRNAQALSVKHGPPPGQAWIDDAAAARLGIASGDPLHLGNARLTVGAILVTAPGGGAGLFSTAPVSVRAFPLLSDSDRVQYCGVIH